MPVEHTALWGASILGGLIAGSILHELVHMFVAHLHGCRTMLDVWGLDVYYKRPEGGLSDLAERTILLAPAASGWAFAGAVVALFGVPPLEMWMAPLYCLWGSYTLLAGPEDYSLRIARGDSYGVMSWWNEQTKHQQRIVGAFACAVVGLAIGHGGTYLTIGPAQYIVNAVYLAILASGVILLLWVGVDQERGKVEEI